MKSLTNEEFMKILSDACKSEDMDAYLDKVLKNYSPYGIIFKGGEKNI